MVRYGKTFRTRRGRLGRYIYVNGRKVSFQASKTYSRAKFRRGYAKRRPRYFNRRY